MTPFETPTIPILDPQQQAALDIMQAGNNVFLSGMAGTGKSYLIQQYVGQSFKNVEMCATTGIAALNLQQSIYARTGLLIPAHTVYRWSGIGLGPKPGQSNTDYYQFLTKQPTRAMTNAMRRIQRAQVLVIDEISMLPGKIFEYLNFHFQQIRADTRPFGGIQIIAVGDFLQLPPVSKTGTYDWCFLSPVWAQAQFISCYLTKIHRQNEPQFINVLNDFREGRIRDETAHILQNRVPRFPSSSIPRLFTHNVQVDKWNTYKLECIEADDVIFEAELKGADFETDFLIKNLVTPQRLRLRRGCRVMFTANLSDGDGGMMAANGECGTVLDFVPSVRGFGTIVLVKKDDGQEVLAERNVWTYDPQRDDSGSFTQIPLRLAYALTIHKSQGLTLDNAIVDIRAAREPGQAYVAISRVRTLGGLWLKDKIAGVFVSPDAINFYRNLKTAI